MLISQRIAQDPHFLKVEGNKKVVLPLLARLRAQVIQATKFVASDYGLSKKGTTVGDIRTVLFGGMSEAHQQRKERVFAEYARLPFALTVIEYGDLMALLERTDAGFGMTVVDAGGFVRQLITIVSIDGETLDIGVNALTKEYKDLIMNNAGSRESAQGLFSALRAWSWMVCETLVFLNCKNVERVAYEPTRRELGSIPKVLQPKFTYHVLNVFRERKAYSSIEAIVSDMHAPSLTRQGRCHVVRGHFKRTKGGLFWWNEFVRNRAHRDTAGVVDKDYCIRSVSA